MNSGAEGMIDLLEQRPAEGVGSFQAKATLLEILGEPPQPARPGVTHGFRRYRRARSVRPASGSAARLRGR